MDRAGVAGEHVAGVVQGGDRDGVGLAHDSRRWIPGNLEGTPVLGIQEDRDVVVEVIGRGGVEPAVAVEVARRHADGFVPTAEVATGANVPSPLPRSTVTLLP